MIVPVLNQINEYSNEAVIWMMKQVEGTFLTPFLAPSYADNWRQAGWLGRTWADLRQEKRLEIVKYGSVAAYLMLSMGCVAFSLLPFDHQNIRCMLGILGAVASTICRSYSMYIGVIVQEDLGFGSSIGVACYVSVPFNLFLSIVDPLNSETRLNSQKFVLFIVTMVVMTKLVNTGSEYMIRKAGLARRELENVDSLQDPVQFREEAHRVVIQDIREGRPVRVYRNGEE